MHEGLRGRTKERARERRLVSALAYTLLELRRLAFSARDAGTRYE